MVIITNYRQEKKGDKIYIRPEEVSVCPICGSKMQAIGSRSRKVIMTDRTQQTYVIRRLQCKECGQVHHELPDLLVPYKRHCAETIEQAVSESEQADTCEQTTIQRIRNWWSDMSQYFNHVMLSLEAKYGVRFTVSTKPREIVRAVVNAHLWTHTRSVCVSA